MTIKTPTQANDSMEVSMKGGTSDQDSAVGPTPDLIGKSLVASTTACASLEDESDRFLPDQVVTGIVNLKVSDETPAELVAAWKAEMTRRAETFKGFLAQETILTPAEEAGFTRHTVIMSWACYMDLRVWLESNERREGLSKAPFAVPDANGIYVKAAGEVIEVETLMQVPQAPHSVRPPPKWKLGIVTWCGVFPAVYCVVKAGISHWLSPRVRDSTSVTLLGVLLCVVPPLVFAVIPFYTDIVGVWLRQPRPKYSWEPMRTLDEGLSLFVRAPPPQDPAVSALKVQVGRLEGIVRGLRNAQTRMRSVRDVEEGVPTEACDIEEEPFMVNGLFGGFDSLKAEVENDTSADARRALPVTGIAHHHVKWEYETAFRDLCSDFLKKQKNVPGFLSMVTLHGKGDGLEYSQEYVNIFKYRSFHEMDAMQRSPMRIEFLQKMRHMLESPSEVIFAQNRHMHDAFSELLVPHGQNSLATPPPVWKTCFLVVIGLMMCVWPVNENVLPMLDDWGLTQFWLKTLITTAINVALNTYICMPFLILIFGGWLTKPRALSDNMFVQFMDRGFCNTWTRFSVSVLYFAILATLIMTDAIH